MPSKAETLPRADFLAHVKKPEYKGDVFTSVQVAALTLAMWAAWHVVAVKCLALEDPWLVFLLKFPLSVVYGLIVMRSFIIMHDCGHRSFFIGFKGSRVCNMLFGTVFSNICCTPTDWAKAHNKHHMNNGNMAQTEVEWAETIFHTVKTMQAKPKWLQYFLLGIRYPAIFFPLCPIPVWWLKYRLPFNVSNDWTWDTTANYRVSNKMWNTFHVLARHYALNVFLGWDMYVLVFWAELVGASMGVMLFHLQHVYDPGYFRTSGWDKTRAAVEGSSRLTLPSWLKFFTLGIEYHHIHHLNTQIAGYRLQQCHEEAPPGLWKNVTVLTYSDMWKSYFYQIYDEDKDVFLTIGEYLALPAPKAE